MLIHLQLVLQLLQLRLALLAAFTTVFHILEGLQGSAEIGMLEEGLQVRFLGLLWIWYQLILQLLGRDQVDELHQL
jgi:hypothetical protein